MISAITVYLILLHDTPNCLIVDIIWYFIFTHNFFTE